jgi:hypothetical protein
LSEEKLKKININLIFLIGEYFHNGYSDSRLKAYLRKSYYKSDVWIRREIIKAVLKLGKSKGITLFWQPILEAALRESDKKIRETAIETIFYLDKLPKGIFKSLLYSINKIKNIDSEIINNIFSKFCPNPDNLFNLLDKNEKYKILNQEGLRLLLMTYFDSVLKLESFHKKIKNSNWTPEAKKRILDEIDMMEKILLSNI